MIGNLEGQIDGREQDRQARLILAGGWRALVVGEDHLDLGAALPGMPASTSPLPNQRYRCRNLREPARHRDLA